MKSFLGKTNTYNTQGNASNYNSSGNANNYNSSGTTNTYNTSGNYNYNKGGGGTGWLIINKTTAIYLVFSFTLCKVVHQRTSKS